MSSDLTSLEIQVYYHNENNSISGSCSHFKVVFPKPVFIHGSKKNVIEFLVDVGTDYSSRSYDFSFNPKSIDFLILTHSHIDHIGKLPFLINQGFKGRIFSSKTTKSILVNKSLDDIYKQASRHKNSRIKKETSKKVKRSIECLNYENFINLTDCGSIQIYTLKNGHIPGSISFLIKLSQKGSKDVNIFFTGDYKKDNPFFISSSIPKNILNTEISAFITESTKGEVKTNSVTEDEYDEKMETIFNVYDTTIITTSNIDKTERMLLKLKKMQDSGKLDYNIPIFITGKSTKEILKLYGINEVENKKNYIYNDFCYSGKTAFRMKIDLINNWMPKNLKMLKNQKEAKVLLKQIPKKIILTSSGNLKFGNSIDFLKAYIENVNACIVISSFVAEQSYTNTIMKTLKEEKIEIDNHIYTKRAAILSLKAPSLETHATQDELLDLYNKFRNIKNFILQHGTQEAKQELKKRIDSDLNIESFIPNSHETYLINSEGVKKIY